MDNSKAILIVNPRTGRYSHKTNRTRSAESISESLASQRVDCETVFTTGPGDAAKIAAQAAKSGVREIIVYGGDGTINEALQGLVGSDTKLAILPGGTANVLARELGLPLQIESAAAVIARRNSQRVHVGVAIDETSGFRRYFLLMAGIGLDAEVVQQVNPELKRRLGKGAFWLTGLSQLAKWNPVNFNLEVNGATYEATFALVGNAASYGRNLAITPGARIDHPEFEICIVQTTSRIQYLKLLSNAMQTKGVQPGQKGVCFVRSQVVRAAGNVPVQVDGEVIGTLPMRFEIAPQTIGIVVP
jgi:YegS/Rv2252/BmrU family lipid kinase